MHFELFYIVTAFAISLKDEDFSVFFLYVHGLLVE